MWQFIGEDHVWVRVCQCGCRRTWAQNVWHRRAQRMTQVSNVWRYFGWLLDTTRLQLIVAEKVVRGVKLEWCVSLGGGGTWNQQTLPDSKMISWLCPFAKTRNSFNVTSPNAHWGSQDGGASLLRPTQYTTERMLAGRKLMLKKGKQISFCCLECCLVCSVNTSFLHCMPVVLVRGGSVFWVFFLSLCHLQKWQKSRKGRPKQPQAKRCLDPWRTQRVQGSKKDLQTLCWLEPRWCEVATFVSGQKCWTLVQVPFGMLRSWVTLSMVYARYAWLNWKSDASLHNTVLFLHKVGLLWRRSGTFRASHLPCAGKGPEDAHDTRSAPLPTFIRQPQAARDGTESRRWRDLFTRPVSPAPAPGATL